MTETESRVLTFLFTDIEGSTKLWEEAPTEMRAALARHDQLLRNAIEAAGGRVFKTVGDAFCAVFDSTDQAVRAAVEAQQAVMAEAWQTPRPIQVRMAIHCGEVESRDNDFFGPPLNRVARLLAVGHGGQVLVSGTAHETAGEPAGAQFRDMGSHRLKDLSRPEQIYQILHPDLPSEFRPLASLDNRPNNLPQQLTTFIGREKELDEVQKLLEGTRLITLTGSGGSGKTRLAIQAAAGLLEEFPDGIWLVELAALPDQSLIPQALATAIGLREEPGRPLLAVIEDHLKPRRSLILLDNCEHVIQGSAQIAARLLGSCPNLRVLASSREPLNVPGETVYRVPSLTLPDEGFEASLKTMAGDRAVTRVMEFETVRLFADRASLSQPGFVVTPRNATALVQVCRQLDGIPLAIELAAARVKVLPVEQIVTKLEDRFRLLTGGSRAALPRQQTLKATIDWSYDLLSENERTLFHRLSVFSGGFTLESAEEVCSDEQIDAWEILDLLSQLSDKSLVVCDEAGGEMRYRLLATLRQYSREKLAATGLLDEVAKRHLDHFVKRAWEEAPKLKGPEQMEALLTLQREHDNLRAALEWALGQPEQAEAAMQLAAGLWYFWQTRGHISEGRAWLDRVLKLPDAPSTAPNTRGMALDGAGLLAQAQGDYAAAAEWLKQALAVRREQNDTLGIATVLDYLGTVEWSQGRYVHAEELYREALEMFKQLDDQRGIAISLNNLGNCAWCRLDYAEAQRLYEESLGIERRLAHQQSIANTLHNLGEVAFILGDLEAARKHYEESLALDRKLENQRGIAFSCLGLGNIALQSGEPGAGADCLRESLALLAEMGDKWGTAYALEGVAGLTAADGRFELTATLMGAADAIREEIGSPLLPSDLELYRERIEAARSALGDGYDAAFAGGRALGFEAGVQAGMTALEPG